MKQTKTKKMNRMLALLLAVVMMVLAVPAMQASATARSADEAINWVKSKAGQGLDMDGAYGAQCVDLILAYYDYLGVSRSSGNGADYAWNALPSGWQRLPGVQPQKGDILVYSGNSSNPYGHVAIYESDRSHYHQNFNSHSYVEKVTYMYNGLSNPYWGVIRPNWSVPPTNNPFASTWVSRCTDNDARIEATLNALYYCTSIGFYYGTSTSYMTKYTEPKNENVKNIWYDMISECGIRLTHATTYYYKFYIVTGGKEYQSDVKSFTTGGSHSYTTSTVTKAATCVSTGTRKLTCACGAAKTETIPVNASNHVNTKNVAATNSTCTTKGYTAGVYCNDCKKYISGHQEKALAGHTITIINKKDATYDAQGYTGDEYCTVCKQTIRAGAATPKLEKPAQPDTPAQTQPQPQTQQPQQQESRCRWCGGNHDGFFGWFIRIFHNLFAAIFGAKY